MFTLVLFLSLLTGCNTRDVVIFDGFSMDDELVGVWQDELTHLGEIFIFNDDGTGVHYRLFNRPTSYRPFVWTRESGYLIIEGSFNGKYSYSIN